MKYLIFGLLTEGGAKSSLGGAFRLRECGGGTSKDDGALRASAVAEVTFLIHWWELRNNSFLFYFRHYR